MVSLIPLSCAVVAVLHVTVSTDIGAHFVEALVSSLDQVRTQSNVFRRVCNDS